MYFIDLASHEDAYHYARFDGHSHSSIENSEARQETKLLADQGLVSVRELLAVSADPLGQLSLGHRYTPKQLERIYGSSRLSSLLKEALSPSAYVNLVANLGSDLESRDNSISTLFYASPVSVFSVFRWRD